MFTPDVLTNYLEQIRQTVTFKKWFFGHYHDNKNVNADEILLYEQGWDVKKALQLIYKSNPTIFEWCASPIVYMEDEIFSAIKELLLQYFSVKKSLYHYWHMAEGNYREYLKGDIVQIKKYF